MERLTMRTPDNFGYAEYQLKPGVDEQDAVSRLAAYEDSGLEPEEIIALAKGTLKSATVDVGTKLYDLAVSNAFEKRYGIALDRMCELAEADKDGRCVVLPCKVETLMERYNALKFPTGDEAETYSTGYRNGHKNGQAELLEYLLGIDTGERNESAEAALKGE